ncbi:MAG: hypothetical protein VX593_11040 [Pseudomonadota bacterium]|nr:hypothetical protein [Pseudomonadota bacterium]
MPLPNRVDPFGKIHAVGARGTLMGNRGGCFHRDDKTLKPTHWASRQWIVCELEFKGRRRTLMSPGRYTELFFLDEATALAGGHRPCFECRRERATAFVDAVMSGVPLNSRPRVKHLDATIAGEVQDRLRGVSSAEISTAQDLPDGAMFASGQFAWLKLYDAAYRWSFEGYTHVSSVPAEGVEVLTPAVTLDALRAGYRPDLHDSINRLAG